MKRFLAITAILAVGILVGSLVTGSVFAAPATPTPGTPGSGSGYMGRGGAGGGFDRMMDMGIEDEVLTLLGMTREQIATERQGGKSLAEIAAAKSVSRDTLISTILAAKKADLDKLLADGKLTQAQADTMYQNMQQTVLQMVDSTTTGGGMRNGDKPRDTDDCPMWDGQPQNGQPESGQPGNGQQKNNMRPGRGGMRGGGSI